MFTRQLQKNIEKRLDSSKAIIMLGPRQVGKTTLIKSIIKDKTFLFLDGDDPTVRKTLADINTEQLRSLLGNQTLLYIDEAQRIDNIGLTLKIIIDQLKDVQVLVTGSSAFELNNQIQETLTGRKWQFELFPFSWQELEDEVGYLKAQQQLETRLVYGFYPEVVTSLGDEQDILTEITNSYLFKDILALTGIRKPEVLEKLLRALALQIGSEVSYNELAQTVGVDKNTINTYIELLIQSYVVFKLPSFSKNLRNEIKNNQKIYFYDVGIRNAVIGNFSPLVLRQDIGYLWENFLLAERMKQLKYAKSNATMYFWRTRQQQEIDYIEVASDQITAFEFKYNPKAKAKIPKTFTRTYETEVQIITTQNFRDFVLATQK